MVVRCDLFSFFCSHSFCSCFNVCFFFVSHLAYLEMKFMFCVFVGVYFFLIPFFSHRFNWFLLFSFVYLIFLSSCVSIQSRSVQLHARVSNAIGMSSSCANADSKLYIHKLAEHDASINIQIDSKCFAWLCMFFVWSSDV